MAMVPPRFDIRMTYAVTGLVNAAVLAVFCFGTPRPWMYLVGSGLFLFTVGACWAMYSALVLKIVGAPGRSGGGRYAMGVSLANLPVAYMAALDGLGAKWFGPKGLPGMDMAVSGVVALAFLGWFWWERVQGLEMEIGMVESFNRDGSSGCPVTLHQGRAHPWISLGCLELCRHAGKEAG